MNKESVGVVVAGFRTESDAKDAIEDLKLAKRQGFAQMGDIALLVRDEHDKLRISESADKGFGRGAMIGGVAGAAVGILAGPIGWATLGGAAVGGLAASLRDSGFPDDDLRAIGEKIRPGAAAVVAVADQTWLDNVERVLEQHGATVTKQEIAAELAEQLEREAADAQSAVPPST
jgi:uncharacterized membrane protein